MRLLLLIALIALIAIPAPLPAQALRIIDGERIAEIPTARHRGHAAVPLTSLGALGGRTDASGDASTLVLLGDTIRFQAFSPFFDVAGRTFQLADPVYAAAGSLFVPLQFLTDWLPARHASRIQWRDGTLRVIGPVAPTAATAATSPAGPAASVPGGPAQGAGAMPAATPGRAAARVVVIDPGHGGRDPGKVAPGGLREKDVTLALSRHLAAELDRRGGYEVHMTRTDDTLVPLDLRPRLANQWKAGRPAALFLSIHANSGPPSAMGYETYFLAEARNEDERRAAEIENAAIEYEDPPIDTADGQGFDRILNNLRNDFYLRASNSLAEVVQRRMGSFHPGPDRGVKQAGFRVLVGAFMPAVLVEVGFLSNAREAALLTQDQFHRLVAASLADAVDHFFTAQGDLLVGGGSGTEPR